jgi:hypothetical protein
MIGKPCIAMVMLAASSTGNALESGVMPVPTSVNALGGCWEGQGTVMDKAVAIAVNAYPIVQDAMLAVEAASIALADPQDQYAAHLVFGGSGKPSKAGAGPIVGYWADSFGGASAVAGRGESKADGFDITYQYPDKAYVNRWRMLGDRLNWQIVTRDRKAVEKPFASYTLSKTACRPLSGGG